MQNNGSRILAGSIIVASAAGISAADPQQAWGTIAQGRWEKALAKELGEAPTRVRSFNPKKIEGSPVQAFGRFGAMEQVSGPEPSARPTAAQQGAQADLNGLSIRRMRFKNEAEALAQGQERINLLTNPNESRRVLHPRDAKHPAVIEVRGNEVLVISGPRVKDAKFLEQARKAAWGGPFEQTAKPQAVATFSAPNAEGVRAYAVDLEQASGPVYENLQRTQRLAAEAESMDPTFFQRVSPTSFEEQLPTGEVAQVAQTDEGVSFLMSPSVEQATVADQLSRAVDGRRRDPLQERLAQQQQASAVAGTAPTDQQAAAGTAPTDQQAAAGTAPTDQQAAAGTAPTDQQAAAGTAPTDQQAAAGTAPTDQQAAAGTAPTDQQAAAGTAPTDQQATASDAPAQVASLADGTPLYLTQDEQGRPLRIVGQPDGDVYEFTSPVLADDPEQALLQVEMQGMLDEARPLATGIDSTQTLDEVPAVVASAQQQADASAPSGTQATAPVEPRRVQEGGANALARMTQQMAGGAPADTGSDAPTDQQAAGAAPTDQQAAGTAPTDQQAAGTAPTDQQAATGAAPTDQQAAAGTAPMDQQAAAGTAPTDQQAAAGTAPTDQQAAAGTAPTDQQAAAGTAPTDQQAAAGTAPTDQQAAAGTAPTDQQAAAGTAPTDQQAAASTAPTDQQAAGTAPTDQQAAAGTAPTDQQAAAGTAPTDQQAAAGTAPTDQQAAAGTAPTDQQAAAGTAPTDQQTAAGTAPTDQQTAAGAAPTDQQAADTKPIPEVQIPVQEPVQSVADGAGVMAAQAARPAPIPTDPVQAQAQLKEEGEQQVSEIFANVLQHDVEAALDADQKALADAMGGAAPTDQQAAAGAAPTDQQTAAGAAPTDQQAAAGTAPTDQQAAGTAPTDQQAAAGTAPTDQQAAAGTAPTDQQAAAGTAPTDQQAAGAAPTDQQAAGAAPTDQQAAGGAAPTDQRVVEITPDEIDTQAAAPTDQAVADQIAASTTDHGAMANAMAEELRASLADMKVNQERMQASLEELQRRNADLEARLAQALGQAPTGGTPVTGPTGGSTPLDLTGGGPSNVGQPLTSDMEPLVRNLPTTAPILQTSPTSIGDYSGSSGNYSPRAYSGSSGDYAPRPHDTYYDPRTGTYSMGRDQLPRNYGDRYSPMTDRYGNSLGVDPYNGNRINSPWEDALTNGVNEGLTKTDPATPSADDKKAEVMRLYAEALERRNQAARALAAKRAQDLRANHDKIVASVPPENRPYVRARLNEAAAESGLVKVDPTTGNVLPITNVPTSGTLYTGEGFKALFPGQPTMGTTTTNGITMKSWAFDKGDERFMVSVTSGLQSNLAGDQLLDGARSQALVRSGGKLINERKFVINNLPARDLLIETGDRFLMIRMVSGAGGKVTAAVHSHGKFRRPGTSPFLASLQIQ